MQNTNTPNFKGPSHARKNNGQSRGAVQSSQSKNRIQQQQIYQQQYAEQGANNLSQEDMEEPDDMDLPDEMEYSAADAIQAQNMSNRYQNQQYEQEEGIQFERSSDSEYQKQGDDQSDKAPSSDEFRSARKLENANNAVSTVKANIEVVEQAFEMDNNGMSLNEQFDNQDQSQQYYNADQNLMNTHQQLQSSKIKGQGQPNQRFLNNRSQNMHPIAEYSAENTQLGSRVQSQKHNQSGVNRSMNRSFNKSLKKSNWMADENPSRPVAKIASTTHELILYDQLNSRDKELLEKSQIVLSQSKLHQMKSEEWQSHDRYKSGPAPYAARSTQQTANTIDRIQQAQQRMQAKFKNNPDKSQGAPSEGHAGQAEHDKLYQNVKVLTDEIDAIKELHQKRRISMSAISKSMKKGTESLILEQMRQKQEDEFRSSQRLIGGVGSNNNAPTFSPRTQAANRGKGNLGGSMRVNAQPPYQKNRGNKQLSQFKNSYDNEPTPHLQADDSALQNQLQDEGDFEQVPFGQDYQIQPDFQSHDVGVAEANAVSGANQGKKSKTPRGQGKKRGLNSFAAHGAYPLEDAADDDMHMDDPSQKEKLSQSMSAANIRRRTNLSKGQPKSVGRKTKYEPLGDEEEMMASPKYNLSAQYQHVKSSYRDTNKAVHKLRQHARETKQELQEQKKGMNEERLSMWGTNPKKSKSKTRKPKKYVKDRYSDVGDEMLTVEPIEQQLHEVDVTDRAMKLMKKNEKLQKADEVMNRLVKDAENRQVKHRAIQEHNVHSFREFQYDYALRPGNSKNHRVFEDSRVTGSRKDNQSQRMSERMSNRGQRAPYRVGQDMSDITTSFQHGVQNSNQENSVNITNFQGPNQNDNIHDIGTQGSPKADKSSNRIPSPIEINQNFLHGGQEEHEAASQSSSRRKDYKEYLQAHGQAASEVVEAPQQMQVFPDVKNSSVTAESGHRLSDAELLKIQQKQRDHNDKVLKYLESSLPQYEKVSEMQNPAPGGPTMQQDQIRMNTDQVKEIQEEDPDHDLVDVDQVQEVNADHIQNDEMQEFEDAQ